MNTVRSISVAFFLIALGLLLPAVATAVPGPIELVSKNSKEQADIATAPAISADGEYVAFEATIGGLTGIFRKDLGSGELVPVAVQGVYVKEPYVGPGAAFGATGPSISADGRYVSFTTTSPLTPGDEAGSSVADSDVYVADMGTVPPTYELASALNGTDEGITYAPGGGSTAGAKVALSANGREVAFTISGASDLLGETEGTPGGQVVVRNLATKQTTLVSVERESATGAMSASPVSGGAVAVDGSGASISADGSTVAWLADNLDEQVPMVQGEPTSATYDEPLWRRIADGAFAPTRRIIGGGDPLAPGCPVGGSLAEPSCQGPFPVLPVNSEDCNVGPGGIEGWVGEQAYETLPQLSADGRTVALLGAPGAISDLFVVNMGQGLDRQQALRQITHALPLPRPCAERNTLAGDAFVTDLAISPDGGRIAFTTRRQQFPRSSLSLITAPPAGIGEAEVYLVETGPGTFERLDATKLGEPSRSTKNWIAASSPSFGDEGQELAFASTASNLVVGDANELSDIFVVSIPENVASPGVSSISPAPPAVTAKVAWKLTASAVSLPDGQVPVRAVVPGAGRLRGQAQALVGSRLRHRKVAVGGAVGKHQGLVRFDLRLAPRFRSLAKSTNGLEGVVRVRFQARGQRDLSAVLPVRFRAHRKQPRHPGGHGR